MTHAEKEAVRYDRRTTSAIAVAHKYGITRQRVHQILTEPPGAGRSFSHPARKVATEGLVHFAKASLAHLNDAEVQAAIREATILANDSYEEIAMHYRCTYHAIQRIGKMANPTRPAGAPRKQKLQLERQRIAAERAERATRDAAIHYDRRSMTVAAIAKKYHLSLHMVFRIQRSAPSDLTRFDGRVR